MAILVFAQQSDIHRTGGKIAALPAGARNDGDVTFQQSRFRGELNAAPVSCKFLSLKKLLKNN